MLVTSSPSPQTLTAVQRVIERERNSLSGFLLWFIAIVLAFVVPLAIVLGAVFVSSWGIPLPIYVAVP